MLLRSINNTLCMYILDWNCFHDNVCLFQSLPFSKSFREIRLEMGPLLSLLFTNSVLVRNFPQHFIWTRTMRRGLQFFFNFKKTRKSNRLQMTSGSTSRQLFKDPDRQLVRPAFETVASCSVNRCLCPRSWLGGGLIQLYSTIKWICASLNRNKS